LSDYTFALRDDSTGQLATLGKAYTGLTDAEIAELTDEFLGLVISKKGNRLEVEPRIVLEIAFDAIRESPRHNSGLALRFPRIVRLRCDKTEADIDTLASARLLLPKS
jgi:DNA ligase-1